MDTQSTVPTLSAMWKLVHNAKQGALEPSDRTALQKLCELLVSRFDYGDEHSEAAREICFGMHDSGIFQTGFANNADQILEKIEKLRHELSN